MHAKWAAMRTEEEALLQLVESEAQNSSTTLLLFHASLFLHSRCSRNWFKMALHLSEGNAPRPTTAHLEAWRAPPQSGAQPLQVVGYARPNAPRT